MIKYIRNIGFLVVLLLSWSCSDELDLPGQASDVVYSDMPVELFIDDVEGFEGTRGVENPKKVFIPGERIHLNAIFYDKKGNIVEKAYKIFELNSAGNWKSMGNTLMYWPANAIGGTFKAYFISRYQQDMFEKDDINKVLRLSDIDDQTDPLYAEIDLEWGRKVPLRFKHILTHLTFTNLDPDISDYFWLVNKSNDKPLYNKFNIRLNSDNELVTEFSSEGDAGYDNLVYVQHRSKNLYKDNIKVGSEVSFFLAPGDYSNVDLRTINNYSYLNYKSEATSDLKANVPYVIDIKTNMGVTFVEDDDDWDDDQTEVTIFNPEEFLQSIVDGSDYEVVDENTQEVKKILQSTSSGTRLLRNISFNYNKEYSKFEIPSGRSFDGGNHYISELASGLFSTNSGTIQHLGLRKIRCKDVELSYYNMNLDNSRWGVLCEMNAGVVHKIKVENSEIAYRIGEGRDQSITVFNLGTLVGSSRGIISEIEYDGHIKITSGNQTDIDATVNIGGFVGQAVDELKEINPVSENSRIEIITNLQGNQATVFVGGAIGQSNSNIEDITLPDVLIDSSQGKGQVGSTGGIAGRLFAAIGAQATFSSCTVSGTIKGFPVSNYEKLQAATYTGGLAGYLNFYNVKNCRTLCNIEVTPLVAPDDSNTYATGGGFGRIVTDNEISGNYVLGTTLKGPENYTGNFAGLVPSTITWSTYQSAGNVAKNILAGKYLGGSIDNSTE